MTKTLCTKRYGLRCWKMAQRTAGEWCKLFSTQDGIINLMILDSFITAPNSRDKLSITTEMAQKVFSYLQVMPEFLDCLLPFGLRERSLDFYSTFFQACDREQHT